MSPSPAREKARALRLLAFDVDGTLTDGRLYFGDHGEAMKAFSVLDGQGLALLKKAGLRLALVTGRRSEMVLRRAEELKIDHVVQGVKDKAQALQEVAKLAGLQMHQVSMMGDDWPDLPAFAVCGLSAAPSDAHAEVRSRADWVSLAPAGAGAVREFCDFVLQSQGRYQKLLKGFLKP